MPAAPGVSSFVIRNDANHFVEKHSRYSPSARGSSQTRQTNNNASLSLAERQQKAANARVPMPATHSMRLKTEPETGMRGLDTTLANRPMSVSSNRAPQPRNTFDDTDLDDTVSSGLSITEGGECHVPFPTDYKRPSLEPSQPVDARHYGQQQGEYDVGNARFAPERFMPENWQAIVRAEKEWQAGTSRPSSVLDDSDRGREVYLQGDQEYDDQDDIDSQGRGGETDFKARRHYIENGQYHHDPERPEPTPSRTRSNQMPPPAPPPQTKFTSTFATTSVPTSKSSSNVEGFEVEAHPVHPAAKKARVDLDYDPIVLQSMSYADLDKEPFEKDPRVANTTEPIDEHGIPLTLHRRLGNLSRMKEEDVRAMFFGQNDQEWEDTGAWFMSQFVTQMRRLMEIRQERRMIALRFELEVKTRQAAVATKTGDVEQELRYLKTGGKDLMKRRISPIK